MRSTSSCRRSPDYGYSKGLTGKIANIRTDPNPFSTNEIAVLMKHGYELVDIAIKTHIHQLIELDDQKHSQWTDRLLDEAAVAEALAWSGSRTMSTFTSRYRGLLQ
jgi:hypothetical protein